MVDWYFIKWVWLGFSLQVFTNFAGIFPLAINGSCISRSMHDSFCFPLFKRRWVLRQYPSLVVAVGQWHFYTMGIVYHCFFSFEAVPYYLIMNVHSAWKATWNFPFVVNYVIWFIKNPDIQLIIIALSVCTTKQQIKLYWFRIPFHTSIPIAL